MFVVDNDDSFLDEGVIFNLLEREFLVCSERLE